MHFDASIHRRGRAVAAVLVALWLAVLGAEWALPGAENAHTHAPHSLAGSAAAFQHSVEVDHPHISTGEVPIPSDAIAEAVVPRGIVTLVALGMVAAVAVAAALWRPQAHPAARGPPRSTPTASYGRDLLARLCIARR